jgi:regulator of protease activity HflC (stomatin/prohibitin superfamily)
MSAGKNSRSIFDGVELFLDRCVRIGEALIVVFLVFLIVGVICFESIWTLCAEAGHKQERLGQVLKTLNDNWKVGLIILIPLFFRGIRAFLERLEEFGNLKAPHKAKTSDPTKSEGE